MSSSYECINVDIGTDVATIEFNRPEKKNCMSPTLHRNMCDALVEIERARVKALVITGVGDAFCGGMDLEQFFLEPFDDRERLERGWQDSFTWLKHAKQFPAVTIAKVNGWCFGGGMEVVGVCDLAIAAEESVWGLSEVNFGIFPGGGTTWAYAHNMPARKKALYYALTGETFTGRQAEELGYVSRSVPRAALDAEVDRVVSGLSRLGRNVLTKTKQVYEKSIWMDFDDSIEWEIAKLWELSRETNDDWIRTALTSFRRRDYRPGLESYQLTRDV